MTVPRVLVRDVSPRLADAELTFLADRTIDAGRAAAQHDGYVHLLQQLGHEVVRIVPAPEHPDGTFVEDAVVVVEDLAVCTRPGAESRRGEVASVRDSLLGLGLRTHDVVDPGTLDGGDVLPVGRHVFVGLGGRTNPDGVEQLRDALAPLGRTVVPVDVTGCLHLKSGATALPDGTVVAVTSWLDSSVFTAAGLEVLEAPEHAGADLLLSGDRVVLSAAAPLTAELIRLRGIEAHPVVIDELEKAECGVTCLSVLVPSG